MDTPRPESWVEDKLPPLKLSETDLPLKFTRDLRSASRVWLGFTALDGQSAAVKHLTHHQHRPVDLNSLMFKMEKILARASKATGDNAMANQYETLANAPSKRDRKNTVERSTKLAPITT